VQEAVTPLKSRPAIYLAVRPVLQVFKDAGFTRWRHLLVWFALLASLAVGVTIHDARSGTVRGDLTIYSLEASRVMYAGGDPYARDEVGRNYKYLPLNAAVLGPLTWVSVPTAQGIWMALNVGLLILCYHNHQMMVRRVLRIPWWVWLIALALTLRFTYANLKMGQWNMSVYALMFTGIVLARRRPFLGGGMIGLAAALKYMPAFLLLYYAAVRDWRTFWGLLLGILFWVFVLPTLLLGSARHAELLQGFMNKSTSSIEYMTDTSTVVGESLHSTLFGYLTPAPRTNVDPDRPFNLLNVDPSISRPLVKALMVLLLAATVVFTWWLGRAGIHRSAVGSILLVGLWFMVFLCITPSGRREHLLTMFTPALGLALVVAMHSTPVHLRRMAIISLACSFFFMILASKIVGGTTYNVTAQVYGAYTFSFVSLMVGCVVWLVAFQRRALPLAATAPIPEEEPPGTGDGAWAQWRKRLREYPTRG